MTNTMLHPVEHKRIIQDLEGVCSVAGLQAKYLRESMTLYCGATEVEWVRNFWKYRAEGMPGIVLEGVKNPDTRCQAMCAALIRNYIDARVIPINTLIDRAREGEIPNPTVLLIPNLYINATSKSLPEWKKQIMYDILLERSVHSKATVVYVESMAGLTSAYGAPFADFLSNFKQVNS